MQCRLLLESKNMSKHDWKTYEYMQWYLDGSLLYYSHRHNTLNITDWFSSIYKIKSHQSLCTACASAAGCWGRGAQSGAPGNAHPRQWRLWWNCHYLWSKNATKCQKTCMFMKVKYYHMASLGLQRSTVGAECHQHSALHRGHAGFWFPDLVFSAPLTK